MASKKQSKSKTSSKNNPQVSNPQTPNPQNNPQNVSAWIQSQSENPIYSPPGFGYPTPPQGFQGYAYPPQPHGFQGYAYPPQQGYHPQMPQQQSFTNLLAHGEFNASPPLLTTQSNSIPSSQSQVRLEDEIAEDAANQGKKGKAKAIPWSQDECEVLAKCWIHISEDATIGTDQRRSDFWNRITEEFLTRRGRGAYRTKDQVYSKYTKMNQDIMFFNDTYLSIVRNYPSGWDEQKVIQQCSKVFKTEKGKAFSFPTVWDIVKDNAKWRGEEPEEDDRSEGSNKRARTSESDYSDAHVNINLNDDASPPTRPAARARPMGRDRAKAQARAKGKAKEVPVELMEDISGLNSRLSRLLDSEATKQEERDLNFLMLDTSHLTGEAAVVAEYRKDKIRKKYNISRQA